MFKLNWQHNKFYTVAVFTFGAFLITTMLYGPILTGNAVDTLTTAVEENVTVDLFALVFPVIAYITIFQALHALKDFFMNRYQVGFYNTIYKALAAKLVRKNRSVSEVINIYNQDVLSIVSNYMIAISNIFTQSLQFILATAVALTISVEIVLILFAITAVSFTVSHLFKKPLANREQERLKQMGKLTEMLNGIFSAVRTINVFLSRPFAVSKVGNAVDNTNKARIRFMDMSAIAYNVNTTFAYSTMYMCIIGSFILVYLGYAQLGQAITLYMLLQYISPALLSLMERKNAIDSTKNVREKLLAILNETEEGTVNKLPLGDISLNNISFSYTDEPFMENINLKFEQGKKYLITGSSGSGKSTMLQLILKELSPKTGNITFGGVDIADATTLALYENMAYAAQNIELVPGTLTENITLGLPYDKPKLENIVKILNLEKIFDNFDIELSEEQNNFSGGELQRITIARMLYKDCNILIFDEFASALDDTNAHAIEKFLLDIKGKTIISISHRINEAVLDRYDGVISVDNGKISVK
ncbi:MAG: ABC transporter ATP-binding protein/permease [Firmicutes bacterium]|nr:ABC transporter ATP-binding protein/permease [Bacillota bacterium]